MNDIAVKFEHVTKQYRLGMIGGGTLKGDLQSWWARTRGKEDPNTKIGTDEVYHKNEKFLALDDINFELKKGEILGIIGHNGAGKSTMLKLLARVTAPTSGTITLDGRVASMLEVGTGFHPELTGRENIYMNGAILGMTKKEIDAKFDEIVEFAEMSQFIETPVKRYSSGMSVKLAFAIAAHLDSEIMVMDEVLAVGDVKFQDKCLGKMDDVSHQEGRTVLYVSHNMRTVAKLCNRCLVLDHGKVVFDGATDEAISLYSGLKAKTTNHTEFNRPRDYWDWYPRTTRMLSCDITNSETMEFARGDIIDAEVKCESDVDASDLHLRFEVFNSMDSLICVGHSDLLPTFKKGKNTSFAFSVNTSLLSEGNYTVVMGLYRVNDLGQVTTVDLAKEAFSFSMRPKHSKATDAGGVVGLALMPKEHFYLREV